LLSLIGISYLMWLSILSTNILAMISSSVYGITLIMLYGASTYYHGCKTPDQKKTLKIVDHACIYLLIAGSYTPFTLGPLKDFGGLDILAIEWAIATVGITLKIFAVDKFQILSLIAYLAMGWLVIFSYSTLVEQMPAQSMQLLFIGGLSYTLGTIFYVWNKLPFNHGIWHLFVLGGSVSHYFCVLSLI